MTEEIAKLYAEIAINKAKYATASELYTVKSDWPEMKSTWKVRAPGV